MTVNTIRSCGDDHEMDLLIQDKRKPRPKPHSTNTYKTNHIWRYQKVLRFVFIQRFSMYILFYVVFKKLTQKKSKLTEIMHTVRSFTGKPTCTVHGQRSKRWAAPKKKKNRCRIYKSRSRVCRVERTCEGDDEQKPPRNNVNVSLGHDANNRWERRRDEQLPRSSCSRACVPVGCRRGVL